MAEAKIKIPYGRQWITEDDIASVANTLTSDLITQGEIVNSFEEKLAQYCGVKYAVAVSSGTAALHCVMFALDIKQEDEVIVPPITFVATANAVLYRQGKPVFSDIQANNLCLDATVVEEKISSRTKAIVPVDFAGYPANIRQFCKIAGKHNLKIIEDAAHVLGAKRDNQQAGFYADAAIFSFHPVKQITTGEGGAIITNDESIYKKCLLFRTHGITKDPNILIESPGGWYYEMHALGYNYRLTDFQAALGISQLSKIEQFIKRRNEIAKVYIDYFKQYQDYIKLPWYDDVSQIRHAYHLFIIQFRLDKFLATRQEIYNAYQTAGIGVQVHYIPIHLQPFYTKSFGYNTGDFPVAEAYYESCLSLPIFPLMRDSELEKVLEVTEQIIRKYCQK